MKMNARFVSPCSRRAALGLMTAALAGRGLSARAADKPKIALSIAPTVLSAPMFVAKDKGYFDKAGLDVSIDTSLQNMAENLPLLAAGHFTIVGTSWGTSVFNALSKNQLVTILATQATIPATGATPFSIMMSAKAYEGGATTLASLKGKKVGIIGVGGYAEYDTVTAVQAAGLKANDVELVQMGRNDIGPAISNGAIAAGWGAEPMPTLYQRQGIVKNISNDAMRNRGPIVFLANTRFMKENAEPAATFLSVFMRAAKELDAQGWSDPQVVGIVSKHTKLPPDVLKSIQFTLTPATLEPDLKLASEMEAYFGGKKLLVYDKPLDFSAYYSPAIVKKAMSTP